MDFCLRVCSLLPDILLVSQNSKLLIGQTKIRCDNMVIRILYLKKEKRKRWRLLEMKY